MGLLEAIAQNQVKAMIVKCVKNKGIVFVNERKLIYTNKDKVVQTLTYEQFADSVINRAPDEMARVGITRDTIVELLKKEYKGREDMEFNQKDIEAVAKSRVYRAESRNTMVWLVAVLVGLVVGMITTNNNRMLGLSIVGIPLIGYVYFVFFIIGKKQKQAVSELLQKWNKGKVVK